MGSTKILFLTTQLPYPPKSGGTVKSWNYVRFLASNYSLGVASLLKDDDEQHIDAFEKAVNLTHFISEKVEIGRSPINLFKSYFLAPSLNVFRNSSASFHKRVNTLAKDYDVLIIDHYEMFQYVPSGFSGKVIMHTHNAEFMLWQRMSELTNNPLKKVLLRIESLRIRKYENAIFNRSHLIFSTPSDIELYKKHGFNTDRHQITYHLGNDDLLELPDLLFRTTEKAITFIGTLSWEPNVDGICWFLDNCWKPIKEKHTDVKLYVLGKNPDPRILRSANNDPSVVFTGFVKNLDQYLQKTRVYIAPLRFGSGMKVKVLEGLYRGVPSVSTSVGAEGLAINSGKEIMIADQHEQFTDACIALLENEKLWNSLRDNSRKVANEKYRWQPLFDRMDKEFKLLLNPRD